MLKVKSMTRRLTGVGQVKPFPSTPWILKGNIPSDGFDALTLKSVDEVVGTKVDGAALQVCGTVPDPALQEIVTVLEYPLVAIAEPLKVTD